MVKVFVKGGNLCELEALHQYRMVGIGKGKILLNIQSKYFTIFPFPRKHYPWEFNKGKHCLGNPGFGDVVVPLEGKDCLKDNGVGSAGLLLPVFNTGEKCSGLWRMLRMVFQQVTKQNVGI